MLNNTGTLGPTSFSVLVLSFFFFFKIIYLAVLGLSCSMRDLVSLIRDRTQAPYTGSAAS